MINLGMEISHVSFSYYRFYICQAGFVQDTRTPASFMMGWGQHHTPGHPHQQHKCQHRDTQTRRVKGARCLFNGEPHSSLLFLICQKVLAA